MTLPKGVIKRSPFLLDTAYDMKGYAFMTSSSAGEAAQESSRRGRSYFTHNLISGMRGAADMNLDGRITLNEAYQFAFDGTLQQTERTMAGAQHPSRHIQMSGTGDVVITEIRKSEAVLVFESGIAGRIFIHNKEGVLLDRGEYRIFAVDANSAAETRIALKGDTAYELRRSQFVKAARTPATVRGSYPLILTGRTWRAGRQGWQVEVTGGFAAINPADLNLRGTFDRMTLEYYGNDYLAHRASQGEISSFVKTTEGSGPRQLTRSVPFAIRLRRRLTRWLDVSVGFMQFSGSRNSSFANIYEVTGLDGSVTTYQDRIERYTLAVKGALPLAGVHIGGNITPSLRLEASVSAGPLFASCRYAFNYQSNMPGSSSKADVLESEFLEEKGKGTGRAFVLCMKLDYALTRRAGVFVESGYAFQKVPNLSGPGTRSYTGHRDSWEGEWAMKQMVQIEPWGTARFLWPSNGWDLFGGNWWRARDFTLDLSGFQARLGVFFRF
jgi:hypothetical protein